MASPKKKTIMCEAQIACDGNEMLPYRKMCHQCEERSRRLDRAQKKSNAIKAALERRA